MILVGLTGGIGTGKSTVSAMLQEAGAVIVDADEIARKAVTRGKPAWKAIVDAFGKDILRPDGEIDRNALGKIIFEDPLQKDRLNRIVHPHVFLEMRDRIRQIEKESPNSVVIQDIPLLIELGLHRDMPDFILVYAPEPIQLRRVMERDGLSEPDAMARIRSQVPIEEKKQAATIVIDNSRGLSDTRAQTLRVFEYLKNKMTDRNLPWKN